LANNEESDVQQFRFVDLIAPFEHESISEVALSRDVDAVLIGIASGKSDFVRVPYASIPLPRYGSAA
jgi:hypothetical protein